MASMIRLGFVEDSTENAAVWGLLVPDLVASLDAERRALFVIDARCVQRSEPYGKARTPGNRSGRSSSGKDWKERFVMVWTLQEAERGPHARDQLVTLVTGATAEA